MVAINDVAGTTVVATGGIFLFALLGIFAVLNVIAAFSIPKTLARHWLSPLLMILALLPSAAFYGVTYYGGYTTTDVGDAVLVPRNLMVWAYPPFVFACGVIIYGMLGSTSTKHDPTDPNGWAFDGTSLGLAMFLEAWPAAGFLLAGLSLDWIDFTAVNYGAVLALCVGGLILIALPVLANIAQVWTWWKRFGERTLGPKSLAMPGAQYLQIVVAVLHWASKIVILAVFAVGYWIQPTLTTALTNFTFTEAVMIVQVSIGTLVTLLACCFTWFVLDPEEYTGPSGKKGKSYHKMKAMDGSTV